MKKQDYKYGMIFEGMVNPFDIVVPGMGFGLTSSNSEKVPCLFMLAEYFKGDAEKAKEQGKNISDYKIKFISLNPDCPNQTFYTSDFFDWDGKCNLSGWRYTEKNDAVKVLTVGNNGNECQEAYLIANKYGERNSMAVIVDEDGRLSLCGGVIIEDTEMNRKVLEFFKDNIDKTDKNALFMALCNFRHEPYVKQFFVE